NTDLSSTVIFAIFLQRSQLFVGFFIGLIELSLFKIAFFVVGNNYICSRLRFL
ncbi:hypothetical protein Leryth_007812, partial [Lithospermum erythrorhizon]